MCSVVGYVGSKPSRSYVMQGLTRLEYRGYDSAGFACLDERDGHVRYVKTEGGIDNLVKKMGQNPIDGFIGIGHTRWATHGVSTEINAHPHFNTDKTISLVHNGIIENYAELKEQLKESGHVFYSDTDTEVIAHLLEEASTVFKTLRPAASRLVKRLKGAFAFAALSQKYPDTLLAVRKSSPLCVGVGDDEMFIASDTAAFSDHTRRVIFLPNESFALIKKDSVELYDFAGKPLSIDVQEIDCGWANCGDKKGFEHFMLKEMYEQKRVVKETVEFCKSLSSNIWSHCGLENETILNLQRLIFFACGTSAHAAQIGSFFFEKLCLVRSTVALASEFRYQPLFVEQNSLYCALSQSGETADTLEAMRMVNELHFPTFAITNVPSSSMVREAQGFLLTQAKQEVAVASTKSFTAQVATLFWLAHRIALEKNLISEKNMKAAERDLLVAAEVFEDVMERYKFEIVQRHAPYYAQFDRFIFIGRHMSYPFAREAALKLKEIAYCFVDCYPAGELKHGPIALIDEKTPVVLFSVRDERVYAKLTAAAQEVKARSGHLIVFAFEGQKELIDLADTVFIIPKVHSLLGPLAMTGLMQLLVYHIAKVLNRPIDKPRNLAKSVTVE